MTHDSSDIGTIDTPDTKQIKHINEYQFGYSSALRAAIETVYHMCAHTKHVNSQPCMHDDIAERLNILNTIEGS